MDVQEQAHRETSGQQFSHPVPVQPLRPNPRTPSLDPVRPLMG